MRILINDFFDGTEESVDFAHVVSFIRERAARPFNSIKMLGDRTCPVIHVVYYGEDVYFKSKTMMSSVYLSTGERYDWGFMQRDVERGNLIYMRQATAEEKVALEKRITWMLLQW